jgi:hypothetical protein
MLRDATGFSSSDRGGTKRIEERSFAVVDVAKDSRDGGTWREEFRRRRRKRVEIKCGFVVDGGVEVEFKGDERSIFRGED